MHSKYEPAVPIGLYEFSASCSRNMQLLSNSFSLRMHPDISLSVSSKQPGARRSANNVCNSFISRPEEADPLDPMTTNGLTKSLQDYEPLLLRESIV